MSEDRINKLVNEIFHGAISDDNISELFHLLYPTKFLYCNTSRQWFSINEYGIYRIESEKLESAKLIIATEFKQYFQDKHNILCKNIPAPEQVVLGKVLKKIIEKLGSEPQKKNIIGSMVKYYAQDDIYGKMDTINKYAFAFNNGVWDLKTKRFRNANPEEFILTTTGYNYAHPDITYVTQVQSILDDIFPNKAEQIYALKTIALCLIGNSLEKFYIWMATKSAGQGSNGKGLLENLIFLAFGNYCGTMPIDYLSTADKTSANGADEVLSSLNKCLIVFINEVDKTTKLKFNKLKMLSGGDFVPCRGIYGKQFRFKPKFSLFILTNYDLLLDSTDEAMERRIEKLPFRNKFVHKPTEPNQRQIDTSLKEKFNDNNYKLALLEILFKHLDMFPKDKKGNITAKLDPPQSIKNFTERFIYENNPVKNFITEKLTVTDNINDIIGSDALHKKFAEFCIEEECQCMSNKEFKRELEKNGIKSKRTSKVNAFCNIKLKQIEMFDDTQEIEFLEEDEDLVIAKPLDDTLAFEEEADPVIAELLDDTLDIKFENELNELISVNAQFQLMRANRLKSIEKLKSIEVKRTKKDPTPWSNDEYVIDFSKVKIDFSNVD